MPFTFPQQAPAAAWPLDQAWVPANISNLAHALYIPTAGTGGGLASGPQGVQNDFGVIGDEIICDYGMKFSRASWG